MTDAPLAVIRNKGFAERTNIEECILLAWESPEQHEAFAFRAAADLAELNAQLATVCEQREALTNRVAELTAELDQLHASYAESIEARAGGTL